jgi:hypothetical protein
MEDSRAAGWPEAAESRVWAIATGDLSRDAFVRCGAASTFKRRGKSQLCQCAVAIAMFDGMNQVFGFAAGGKFPWTS